MISTKTVTALIKEVYGESFAQAFDEVDLIISIADEFPTTITDIAEKYLDKVIDQAISDIELEQESMTIDFKTSRSKFKFSATGKWILVVVITIAALVLGTEQMIQLIKAIF